MTRQELLLGVREDFQAASHRQFHEGVAADPHSDLRAVRLCGLAQSAEQLVVDPNADLRGSHVPTVARATHTCNTGT